MLIREAYSKKMEIIYDEREKLIGTERTTEEENYLQELGEEASNLRRAHNDSILFCPLCSSSKKDMVFQPYRRRWLCVEDFEDLIEKYERKKKSKLRRILEKPGNKELHINMLEDVLEYDKETLKKLFREWGFKVQKIPGGIHVIVPEEDKECFLKHLDKLIFPW